jgi:energy-coupling factor transport system permease protein
MNTPRNIMVKGSIMTPRQTDLTSIRERTSSFQPGDSGLHKLNPICKVLLLVLITILAFSGTNVLKQAVISVVLVLGIIISRISPRLLGARLKILVFFSLTIVAVQTLFYKYGIPLTLFSLGKIKMVIWSLGMVRGIAMALRFLNVVGGSFLFVATTDPNHLAYSLMQAGIPYRYGFTLVAALRFIPVFAYEMNQVRNAQLSKGIDPGSINLRNLPRYVRYTILPLVISALEKVDNLTISMEGRGFGLYEDRTYRVSFMLQKRDYMITFVTMLVIIVLWVFVS